MIPWQGLWIAQRANRVLEEKEMVDSPAMVQARKQLYRSAEEYEESLVTLFCNAYRDATGVWPHTRLEEALREAVRGTGV